MHMGRKLTVLWDEGELGNSVMLFTALSLLSFPMCPTDSIPNWASCLDINVVTIIVVCTQRTLYFLFAQISASQANVTVRVA